MRWRGSTNSTPGEWRGARTSFRCRRDPVRHRSRVGRGGPDEPRVGDGPLGGAGRCAARPRAPVPAVGAPDAGFLPRRAVARRGHTVGWSGDTAAGLVPPPGPARTAERQRPARRAERDPHGGGAPGPAARADGDRRRPCGDRRGAVGYLAERGEDITGSAPRFRWLGRETATRTTTSAVSVSGCMPSWSQPPGPRRSPGELAGHPRRGRIRPCGLRPPRSPRCRRFLRWGSGNSIPASARRWSAATRWSPA